jgi:protein TonB
MILKALLPFVAICLAVFTELKAAPADTVYTHVDTMPEYAGGAKGLIDYLQDSIAYTRVQWQDNIPERKVLVRFVVNEDGSLSDFNVLHSPSPYFDTQVIKALKNMPPFKPGIKDGKPVKVYYVIPICFKT